MIRKTFKNKSTNSGKIHDFIEKYKIPREYLSSNRKSITKGVFIGLFWGFIPMPMQMLAVLATTPLMRFNVPIAISMVWLSNPLTMPFMYYMEYLTGNFILGRENIDSIELSLEWFSGHMSEIFVPLYVGTAFYSLVVSSIVYLVINRLWRSSVQKERSAQVKIRKENSKALN